MILKRTWRPDLSSAARMTLIAVALGVLPWTPRAFSQNAPTPPTRAEDSKANSGDPMSKDSLAQRPASDSAAQAPAAPVEDPRRTKYGVAKKPTTEELLEERLDLLEAKVNELITVIRKQLSPQLGGSDNTAPTAPGGQMSVGGDFEAPLQRITRGGANRAQAGTMGGAFADSGMTSGKAYPLTEQRAKAIIALLESFGHQHVHIYGYGPGKVEISASPNAHKQIEALIELLQHQTSEGKQPVAPGKTQVDESEATILPSPAQQTAATSAAILLNRAMLLEKNGEPDKAIEVYERLLKQYPKASEAEEAKSRLNLLRVRN